MRAKQSILGVILLVLAGFAAFFCYSWGWSERFLAPVHVGMSRTQVQMLLGSAPHVRSGGGAETWDYTRLWSRDARVYLKWTPSFGQENAEIKLGFQALRD
jgi:hypothetical protein